MKDTLWDSTPHVALAACKAFEALKRKLDVAQQQLASNEDIIQQQEAACQTSQQNLATAQDEVDTMKLQLISNSRPHS